MKNRNTSKILVVGATGFLGMEICRLLTAANKNVSGLVRKTSAAEKVNSLKQLGIQLVEGDHSLLHILQTGWRLHSNRG